MAASNIQIVQTLKYPNVENKERFQIVESISMRVVLAFGALLCSQLDMDVLGYLEDHPHVKHTLTAVVES